MKMGWIAAKAEMKKGNWDAKDFIFEDEKKCVKCYLGIKK